MDYALLDCQAAYCLSKGENEWALECAKRGVTAAPSEFSTWARLAEVYVALEQWDLALLTLNSCPMFSYQDKDSPRMPEPSRVLLPILAESALDEIDEGQPRQGEPYDQVHVSLRKLQAATYQGTFLKAYSLLTEIAARIGWDALLKTRSVVFVMEEEYRTERQSSMTPRAPTSKNASTVALSGTPNGASKDEEETNGDSEEDEDDAKTLAEGSKEGSNGKTVNPELAANQLMDKPLPTIKAEEVKSGGDDTHDSQHQYTHFHNKRLCERWLDNLFMVLYDDLRIYTIWRTEMAQYRQQQMQYKKSAAEWEILGDLAERLHHTNEALEAYQQCLSIRFSPKAMKGMLKMYEKKNDTRNTLASLIRLITWQYRWYSEVCSPDVTGRINKLLTDSSSLRTCSTRYAN
jgi:Chs5-Arf1p-binding protein BUD7/BCH1